MGALCLRWPAPAWFYNAKMYASLAFAFFLCCLAPGLTLAQTPSETPRNQAAPAADKIDQRIEKIHHEDAGSRIDELRVGGETKSITVQPKGNVPPYELGTEGGNQSPSASKPESGKGGSPGWKVKEF